MAVACAFREKQHAPFRIDVPAVDGDMDIGVMRVFGCLMDDGITWYAPACEIENKILDQVTGLLFGKLSWKRNADLGDNAAILAHGRFCIIELGTRFPAFIRHVL